MDGFAALALGAAEQAFPIIQTATVFDRRPLAKPPALAGAVAPAYAGRGPNAAGVATSALACVLGLATFARGRRSVRQRGSR